MSLCMYVYAYVIQTAVKSRERQIHVYVDMCL